MVSAQAQKKRQLPRSNAPHGMSFRHAKARKRDRMALPNFWKNWSTFFNLGISSFRDCGTKPLVFIIAENGRFVNKNV